MTSGRGFGKNMKIRRPSSLARRVRVLNIKRGRFPPPSPPSALDPLHFSTAPLSNPFGGCPSSKQPLRQFFKIREKASRLGSWVNPPRGHFRGTELSEGLFRARLDAPSGGALGGVVLWGGPRKGCLEQVLKPPRGAPSEGLLRGVGSIFVHFGPWAAQNSKSL